MVDITKEHQPGEWVRVDNEGSGWWMQIVGSPPYSSLGVEERDGGWVVFTFKDWERHSLQGKVVAGPYPSMEAAKVAYLLLYSEWPQ